VALPISPQSKVSKDHDYFSGEHSQGKVTVTVEFAVLEDVKGTCAFECVDHASKGLNLKVSLV
jgi:hypothetical protein